MLSCHFCDGPTANGAPITRIPGDGWQLGEYPSGLKTRRACRECAKEKTATA